LAWNIGAMGSTRSYWLNPKPLPIADAMECRYDERWL